MVNKYIGFGFNKELIKDNSFLKTVKFIAHTVCDIRYVIRKLSDLREVECMLKFLIRDKLL